MAELTKYRNKFKFFALVAWIFILSGSVYFAYRSEFDNLKTDYLTEKSNNTKFVASGIQEKFQVIYRELRTIARLPSVKDLTIDNKILSSDSKITIQEIYNNIYESFNISELYIVPVNFDPNRPATKTSANVPLMTFDEYITNRNQPIVTVEKHSTIPEVENFEYHLMVQQLDYLKSKFPKLENISGLNYPLLTGHPVITCDNSQMDEAKPNDEARKGLVLSVPFYNAKQELAGLISGVILVSKIQNLLPSEEFDLYNKENQIRISKSSSDVSLNRPVTQSAKLDISDPIGQWSLNLRLAEQSFMSSEIANKLRQKYVMIYIILIGISLFLTFYFINLEKMQNFRLKQNENLEAKLKKKTEELEQSATKLIQAAKLSTLGEMATGIAHEVSNPMAVISSKAEKIIFHLESGNELQDEQKEDILKSSRKILEMVSRTSKIIKGLRSFARQGEHDPFEPYSVRKLIQESIELTEHRVKSIHATLKVSEVPDIYISCRAAQVDQVIVNLINNSVDAIENFENPWIAVDVEIAQEMILIKVTDCGPGISKEIQEKLLNPFFTTKEAGKGTGVGLSISKSIINEHHGVLIYNPHVQNTQFVIQLPILKAKAA